MANVEMITMDGATAGSISLDAAIWEAPKRNYLMSEIVHWQRAKRRQGTQSAQTRGDVSATTKKPFKQKGTGNARQGDVKAPHMIGGGVAFAPKPRDYSYRMPKAKRRTALASALSIKMSEGNVKVIKAMDIDAPKTKAVITMMGALDVKSALFVDGDNVNLNKSARNVPKARYLHVNGLNVFDLLKYETLVITEAAAKTLEERLIG